jgi:integrase
MVTLSEEFAAKLVVPGDKKEALVFDDDLPGFGIRKFASGKASWFVKFNVGSQQRRVTLGNALAPKSYADAKKRAGKILSDARVGIDARPAIEERKAKASAGAEAATVGELVPRYLKAVEKRLSRAWLVDVKRYLERSWKPLHAKAAETVTRAQIVNVLDVIEEQQGATTADRARACLSAFFAWAIDRGHRSTLNPVGDIARRATSGPRERVLSEAELVSIWRACGDNDYGRVVKLLILTAQRRTEIGGLMPSEVDLARREIALPGARTKNRLPHVVPLSDQALAILASAEPKEGGGIFGKNGFTHWSKSKAALDARLPADMPAWTIHDLRRSAITLLNELGFAQPHICEAIANHISGHKQGVAGVYNKAAYSAEKRRALDLWGAHVERLVSGKDESTSNVVAFSGSR